jgi:hypothetical protein
VLVHAIEFAGIGWNAFVFLNILEKVEHSVFLYHEHVLPASAAYEPRPKAGAEWTLYAVAALASC